MGLLGALFDVADAAIKVAVSPLAVLEDVSDTLEGNPKPSETKKLVKGVVKDLGSAVNEILS